MMIHEYKGAGIANPVAFLAISDRKHTGDICDTAGSCLVVSTLLVIIVTVVIL